MAEVSVSLTLIQGFNDVNSFSPLSGMEDLKQSVSKSAAHED